MGNWNINIQGIGCHHNADNPTDADRMAAEFAGKLREAGHTVEHATFTSGGKTDLAGPDRVVVKPYEVDNGPDDL